MRNTLSLYTYAVLALTVNAVLVTDRWAMRAPRCIVCARPARPAGLPL